LSTIEQGIVKLRTQSRKGIPSLTLCEPKFVYSLNALAATGPEFDHTRLR